MRVRKRRGEASCVCLCVGACVGAVDVHGEEAHDLVGGILGNHGHRGVLDEASQVELAKQLALARPVAMEMGGGRKKSGISVSDARMGGGD